MGLLEPIGEAVEDNSDVVKAVDVSLIFTFPADKLFTGSSFVLFCFCLDSVGIDSVESLLNFLIRIFIPHTTPDKNKTVRISTKINFGSSVKCF